MRLAPLLLASAVLACDAEPEPRVPDGSSPADTVPSVAEAPPGLSADRAEYRLRPDGVTERTEIPYAYHNPGPDTLYQPTCRAADGTPAVSVGLQRRAGSEWEDAWFQPMNECLSEPLVIGPGETFRDTLQLILHPQDSVHAWALTPMSELPGEFRLVWVSLLRTYDANAYPFGEELALEDRVSSGFSLQR